MHTCFQEDRRILLHASLTGGWLSTALTKRPADCESGEVTFLKTWCVRFAQKKSAVSLCWPYSDDCY
jgi:hypothetical protein